MTFPFFCKTKKKGFDVRKIFLQLDLIKNAYLASPLPSSFLNFGCSQCNYQYALKGLKNSSSILTKLNRGSSLFLKWKGKHAVRYLDLLQEYQDRIDEDDVLQVAIFHPTREDLMQSVNAIGATVDIEYINGVIHLPGLDAVSVRGLDFGWCSRVH